MRTTLVILLSSFLIVLVGCGSAQRKDQKLLRDNMEKGDTDAALSQIQKSPLKGDEKSRLLWLVEKGLIHHARGEYAQSLLLLNEAKDLSQQLFTKSLSTKALTIATNDTLDIYYGTRYERSLIQFYLVLNHLLMYQKGKAESYLPLGAKEGDKPIPEKVLSDTERRFELTAARAEVLAWDTIIKGFRADLNGKSVFKDDLLAKLLGAYVHELIGGNDDQIALQLYLDAEDLLFKNYNAYATFNSKANVFKSDFDKLPSLSKEKVIEGYVSPTPYALQLKRFIDERVLTLTLQVRPNDFDKNKKRIDADSALADQVKRDKKTPANVAIVVEVGLIPEKTADKTNIGLEGALEKVPPEQRGAVLQIGLPILTSFAMTKLGMTSPTSAGAALAGTATAMAAVSLIGIEFELPKIESTPIATDLSIDVVSKEGRVVATSPLAVTSPLGDIAQEAIQEDSILNYTKVGVRVALKHALAFAAAYGVYTATEKSFGQFGAKTAALASYIAASKGIAASEKADLRYWAILPHSIRFAHMTIPPGEYTLRAKAPNGLTKELGALVVAPDKRQIVNLRLSALH